MVDRVLDLYFTQEDDEPASAPTTTSPFREPSSDYWEFIAQREREAARQERLEAQRRVEAGGLLGGDAGADGAGEVEGELDEALAAVEHHAAESPA
jgi:hypothetical protein